MNRKASFTIEAALLMPFLLFVMLMLMQISFFLYNREAVTVMASQAVLMGVQMEQDGKYKIEKKLSDFLETEAKEKLLYTDNIDWDISVSLAKVKVKISLSQKTIFKSLNYKISKEMCRLNPASLLWEAERWQN